MKEQINSISQKIESSVKASEERIMEVIKNNNKAHPSCQSIDKTEQKKDDTCINGIERQSIINIKNLDELLEYLEDRDFKYDEAQGVLTCNICLPEFMGPIKTTERFCGLFNVNRVEYNLAKTEKPTYQPKVLTNLKSHILSHIFPLKPGSTDLKHIQMLNKLQADRKKLAEQMKVNYNAGMNVFRIRYTGILHANSKLNFETDILTAKLNGTEVGNINHSRKFASKLTDTISDIMDANLKTALGQCLDCTNEKPPVGIIMDKMTPNKRTGQIHGLIVPVPSNPLSEPLLTPVMLNVPPVTKHDANGLAVLAKDVVNKARVDDSQIEGVGWDGQYVKLGVLRELLQILNVPKMSIDERSTWITQIW